MRSGAPLGVLVLGLLFGSSAAHAEPARRAPTASEARAEPARLRFDVKRTTLDNGLRVVLLVDRTLPTVAIELVYDVGARDEERGRSGFAHLFEHMMFQGSANVARGDHFKLVTAHGGTTDATTYQDRTRYYTVLPSGELALGLWLEADRMKSLDVSQNNLDNQRAVVKEEYRTRVENAAYARAVARLQELVYQGHWPYEHPGIGTMRDLDAAELSWVRAFHDRYYAPGNAVLAIAGDFDEAEALSLVRRFFGGVPKKDVPPRALPPVPEQTSPRTVVVEDVHAKLPALFMGWVVPPSDAPDRYALEIAAALLGDGESSRLRRALVRERPLAVEVDVSTRGLRGPDMLQISARLTSGAKVEAVEKLVLGQLTDVAKLGPSDQEMAKIKARIQARFLLGLQSNAARAERLAQMELSRGDASAINGELERYLAVTKEDVKRVVALHLAASKRSVVEVKPGAAPARDDKTGAKR